MLWTGWCIWCNQRILLGPGSVNNLQLAQNGTGGSILAGICHILMTMSKLYLLNEINTFDSRNLAWASLQSLHLLWAEQNWTFTAPELDNIYLVWSKLNSASDLDWTASAQPLSVTPPDVTEDRFPTHSDGAEITKRDLTKNVSKGLKFHQKIVHRGGRHVLVKSWTSLLSWHGQTV